MIYQEFETKWKEPGNRQSIEVECGVFLHDFIIENDLKVVVETGICQGFSSWCLLKALDVTDGSLISIEPCLYDQKHLIVDDYLYNRWMIIRNYSTNILDRLFDLLKSVDLFWHDSNHEYETQKFEFDLARQYATYVGAHNVDYSNAWNEMLSKYSYPVIIKKKSQRNWWSVVKCKGN